MRNSLYVLLLSVALRLSGADFTPGYAIIDNLQEASGSFIAGSSLTAASGAMVYGGLAITSDPSWAGKIVLLDRGTNTFVQKLQNAKASGAVGALIANNVSGVYTASLGTATSTLPALSISKEDGAKLKTKLNSTASISLSPPVVPTPTAPAPTTTSTAPTFPVVSTNVKMGVLTGSIVTFIATADGTLPISFQWKREGADLTGKTGAVLTLNDVSLIQGNYTVTATNTAGSATSATYFLQIASP